MKGYTTNIEEDTLQNDDFRRVLYTAKNIQLVLMSIPPGEEISEEVHEGDQFIRIEEGEGEAVLGDFSHTLADGSIVLIPAGVSHVIKNVSKTDSLKLYSLYAPPHHKDKTVHKTKASAATEEHFDGLTTESYA